MVQTYRKIRCACGNVMDRRNVRSSGMAVCRCGNNFTAESFETEAHENQIVDASDRHRHSNYDVGHGDGCCCYICDVRRGARR